jgi:hypothetical protein
VSESQADGTIVRATCPACGDVELPLSALTLQVCVDDCSSVYAFACPACRARVSKGADDVVVDVLLASGVELAVWSYPAELSETHEGPPLTLDDVLDFHLLLEASDWFSTLADTVVR